MSVAVLSMSDGELRRLEVLRDVDRGGLPVGAAAQLLERSERQVWRLLKAFRAEGAPGLISKKRGRPSNRKTSEALRSAVLWIVRQNYADFGPTLAAEKLAGEHGFAFSSETLRKWMIAEGLWLDRKQRRRRVHQPRHRRECVGELVQVDGCEHVEWAAQTYVQLAPWLGVFPGLAIATVVFAWNLLGDALRDVLDPRLRGTW